MCGLSEGLESGLQALGSFIVGSDNHAIFFAFVSNLDVAGDFVGNPVQAAIYTIRDGKGHPAGYAFAFSAVSIVL